MREGEERIVLYERDEMLKQIEALQQEIWQARQERDSQQRIAIREMEKVGKLTKDKDEQAAKLMQYDTVLRQARQILSGVNVARCPYCWGKDTHHENCDIKIVIDAIVALLGGKEDA